MTSLFSCLFVHPPMPHFDSFREHLFSKWALSDRFSTHPMCLKQHDWSRTFGQKWDVVPSDLRNIKPPLQHYRVMHVTATSTPRSVFPLHPAPTFPYLAWYWGYRDKKGFVCKKTVWKPNDNADDSNNNGVDLSSPHHASGIVLSAVHILLTEILLTVTQEWCPTMVYMTSRSLPFCPHRVRPSVQSWFSSSSLNTPGKNHLAFGLSSWSLAQKCSLAPVFHESGAFLVSRFQLSEHLVVENPPLCEDRVWG